MILDRRTLLRYAGASVAAGLLSSCRLRGRIRIREEKPSITCEPETYGWPMYGYTPARTNAVPARRLPAPNGEIRRLHPLPEETGRTFGSAAAPPVIHDGVVYIAGTEIEAVDVETGTLLWSFDPEDDVETSPTLGCGTVYVTGLNTVYALDMETGERRWNAEAPGALSKQDAPIVHDGVLYTAGGRIRAMDAETGRLLWEIRPGPAPSGYSPHGIALADRLYVAGANNEEGYLSALALATGEEWWRTSELGLLYTAPAVHDGVVYAIAKTGQVSAVAADDGTILWQREIEHGVYAPPAIGHGTVYVTSGNGNEAYAFGATTGEKLWHVTIGRGFAAPVVISDKVLFTGTNHGIYVFDQTSEKPVWEWTPEDYRIDYQPVVTDGRLYFVHGGEVYVLER